MNTPLTTALPARRVSALLALFTAAMFLVNLNSLMLGPLLVPLARDFHSTVGVTGLLVAATSFSWAIMGLLGGPFSDVYGRRPMLLIGITIMSLGALLSGLSWNMAALAVFRVISGVGAALIPSNITAAIGDMFPAKDRGRAFGATLGLSQLGTVAGVPVVALIAGVAGWRVTFYLTTLLLAALLAAFLLAFPRTNRTARLDLAFGSRVFAPLRVGWVSSLMVSNGAYRVPLTVVPTYLAAFMVERHGLSVSLTALPLALLTVGLAAGSMIGGRLAQSAWGNRAALLGSVAAGALALVAFAPTPSPMVAALAASACVGLVSAASVINVTSIIEVKGEMRGGATALLATFHQTGVVAGAAVGGVIVGLGGFTWLGVVGLAGAWAGAVAAAASVRARRGESGAEGR